MNKLSAVKALWIMCLLPLLVFISAILLRASSDDAKRNTFPTREVNRAAVQQAQPIAVVEATEYDFGVMDQRRRAHTHL